MENLQHRSLIRSRLLQLAVTLVLVSVVTGTLVAFFLWSLDEVTILRWRNPWLLWLLPVAGVAIHFLYKLWGGSSERGNNLIIDAIHETDTGVPARMAPLVLLSTLITHLFGGSAGREGTAVQVGGSMAAYIGRKLRVPPTDTALVLRLGIAAGFGAVFGTPLAGAVFAVEVPARGKVSVKALVPCLIAAFGGHWVCMLWGAHHTHYSIASLHPANGIFYLHPGYVFKSAVAGVLSGLVAWMFIFLSRQLKNVAAKYVQPLWLMPVAGGLLVIVLFYVVGTDAYLGLGVNSSTPGGLSIVNAFHEVGVDRGSWLWKMLFTVITLSMGFKGGEVTPLFFIGAALGNTLSSYINLPVDLGAGLGFVAVFAAAANTPLACVLMGVELFGGEHTIYFAVACYVAFFASGKTSIYSAQKLK